MRNESNATINTISGKEEKNMKRRVAILTKSKKYGGYCVAGIDIDTNEWVRLERPGFKSLRREHLLSEAGRECGVLDVVEVECLDRPSDKAYHPEDVYLNPNVPFKCLSRTTWAEIISRDIEAKNERGLILGSNSMRETEYQVGKMGDKTSLQLIKVSDLIIYNEPKDKRNELGEVYGEEARIKAKFTYQGEMKSGFSVTDFEYMELAENNNIYIPTAYLVVSRGEPFKHSLSNCIWHYSLVAQIIKGDEVDKAA